MIGSGCLALLSFKKILVLFLFVCISYPLPPYPPTHWYFGFKNAPPPSLCPPCLLSCMCSAHRGQKRATDLLEVELQEMVLVTKLGSSARTVLALNH